MSEISIQVPYSIERIGGVMGIVRDVPGIYSSADVREYPEGFPERTPDANVETPFGRCMVKKEGDMLVCLFKGNADEYGRIVRELEIYAHDQWSIELIKETMRL